MHKIVHVHAVNITINEAPHNATPTQHTVEVPLIETSELPIAADAPATDEPIADTTATADVPAADVPADTPTTDAPAAEWSEAADKPTDGDTAELADGETATIDGATNDSPNDAVAEAAAAAAVAASEPQHDQAIETSPATSTSSPSSSPPSLPPTSSVQTAPLAPAAPVASASDHEDHTLQRLAAQHVRAAQLVSLLFVGQCKKPLKEADSATQTH